MTRICQTNRWQKLRITWILYNIGWNGCLRIIKNPQKDILLWLLTLNNKISLSQYFSCILLTLKGYFVMTSYLKQCIVYYIIICELHNSYFNIWDKFLLLDHLIKTSQYLHDLFLRQLYIMILCSLWERVHMVPTSFLILWFKCFMCKHCTS